MMSILFRDRHVHSLWLEFGSPEEPLAKGDHGLDGILDIVENEAGDLTPDKVYVSQGRTARYSRAGAHKGLSREKPPGRSVWVERWQIPEMQMGIHFSDLLPHHFHLDAYVAPLDFFADEAKARHVVSFMRTLAREYRSLGGYAHGSADYLLSRARARDEGRSTEYWDLDEIFWLNILGKGLVRKIGRRRALSTPAEHLEELPNGSILFLTRPTPQDFGSEAARVAQAKALVHLRPELRYKKILAKLHARSEVFVPVEPRWDPDVAPFFAEIIQEADLTRLYPVTARLNGLEIPPVSEWLPLEAAPPTDVDDPEAAIDRYEGYYAESLVATLFKKVPELRKGRPEALPKLDGFFYLRGIADLPRPKEDDWIFRAAGAYLGMLMVKHLGGRWVPRKSFDEVQVIIGDRAFLPILRARRHLAKVETALQCSLTQLYHFAARHLLERALAGEKGRSGAAAPRV